MKALFKIKLLLLTISLSITGCVSQVQPLPKADVAPMTAEEMHAAAKVGINEVQFKEIKGSQLYQLSPRQTDQYLRILHELEPDLRKRIGLIAEKNIGQPYELYLLGEAPFEPYDAQPLFELSKSDCVVFVEHTYAMGMANNWGDFFKTLQHIRYNKGEVGLVTRNHYTEYDWNNNNSWLIEDISEIVGEQAVKHYEQVVNKERFFAKQFSINVPTDNVTIYETYVPNENVPQIIEHLQTGDFVNFVRSTKDGSWVGHVGIIKREDDGTVNVIHSASPKVRKENLLELSSSFLAAAQEKLAEGKVATLGFKFLRLQETPLENLAQKFNGEIPPIIMNSTSHDYLTREQVKAKLKKMSEETKQAQMTKELDSDEATIH